MSDDREHDAGENTEDQQPAAEEEQAAPAADPPIKDEHWYGALSEWIDGHLRGSPVSMNTGAWNWLHQKLPAFRDILQKRMTEDK